MGATAFLLFEVFIVQRSITKWFFLYRSVSYVSKCDKLTTLNWTRIQIIGPSNLITPLNFSRCLVFLYSAYENRRFWDVSNVMFFKLARSVFESIENITAYLEKHIVDIIHFRVVMRKQHRIKYESNQYVFMIGSLTSSGW